MTDRQYSYKYVPTLREFSRDNTFIRAVCGPFGSGKSSACVIEIAKRAMAQRPDADGVRRTKCAVIRNCYDDQTEILTENRGWQLFKDLQPEDKVATLQDGKYLEYKQPIKLCEYDYTGEMIGLHTQTIDFLVTPDHKLYVSRINGRNKKRAPYEHREAQEVFGKTNVEFQTTVEWNRGTTDKTELFFEFLGFWFAEGSTGEYTYEYKAYVPRWTVTQKGNKEYVVSLLTGNNIAYSICKRENGDIYRLSIDGHESLFQDLCRCGKSIDRSVPLWIKQAPATHLRAFLRGYIMGDGRFKDGPHNTTRAWTSSWRLANDIQEIAFKAGYAVVISHRSQIRNGANAIEWNISFLSDKRLHPQPVNQNGKSKWYRQQYSGKVYCVEMPDQIVCVRRDGKYHWGIRSFPQLKDTTIPTFLHWMEHLGEYKETAHDFYLTKLQGKDGSPVHCIIHFRALDKPQDIRNLLSLELTFAWFNEAREIHENIVNAMRGRVGRYPPRDKYGIGGATWKGIWMDTNPPDTDHWFYKLLEEKKPARCAKCTHDNGGFVLAENGVCPKCKKSDLIPLTAIFHQPSGFSDKAENLPYLPTDYYQMLAAGMDKEFVNVYVHGQYGYLRDGKPVYENYAPDIHYSSEVLTAQPGFPIIIAFDNTGLTQACVILQYMPTGQLRVLHEWLEEGMGTRRLARDLVKPFVWANYPGVKMFITGDPAGVKRADTDERTTFQEIMEAFNVFPEPARSNAWQSRFNAVDSFLMKRIQRGGPALLVSKACKWTHRGFMGEYKMRRLQKFGGEKYLDRPEKNLVANVHDAIQYGAMFTEDMYDLSVRRMDESQLILPNFNLWNAYT